MWQEKETADVTLLIKSSKVAVLFRVAQFCHCLHLSPSSILYRMFFHLNTKTQVAKRINMSLPAITFPCTSIFSLYVLRRLKQRCISHLLTSCISLLKLFNIVIVFMCTILLCKPIQVFNARTGTLQTQIKSLHISRFTARYSKCRNKRKTFKLLKNLHHF